MTAFIVCGMFVAIAGIVCYTIDNIHKRENKK